MKGTPHFNLEGKVLTNYSEGTVTAAGSKQKLIIFSLHTVIEVYIVGQDRVGT